MSSCQGLTCQIVSRRDTARAAFCPAQAAHLGLSESSRDHRHPNFAEERGPRARAATMSAVRCQGMSADESASVLLSTHISRGCKEPPPCASTCCIDAHGADMRMTLLLLLPARRQVARALPHIGVLGVARR